MLRILIATSGVSSTLCSNRRGDGQDGARDAFAFPCYITGTLHGFNGILKVLVSLGMSDSMLKFAGGSDDITTPTLPDFDLCEDDRIGRRRNDDLPIGRPVLSPSCDAFCSDRLCETELFIAPSQGADQRRQILAAFQPAKTFGGFEHGGSHPPDHHLAAAPALHVPMHVTRPTHQALDGIRRRE
jgi:hypothetical protein